MIPDIYYYFWNGGNFQYVYYLSIVSLLQTSHPQRVEIYYKVEPQNNPYWNKLKAFPQVHCIPLDFDALLRGIDEDPKTFEVFFRKAKGNHLSDFFRYIVLKKGGGVYLDFDTLVIKDLTPLLATSFFAGEQHPDGIGNTVNGAILGAEAHHPILDTFISCIRDAEGLLALFQRKNFRKGLLRKFFFRYLHWCDVGPTLLSEQTASEAFSGVIHPRAYFYFFDYRAWEQIFEDRACPEDAYILHYWGSQSTAYTQGIDEKYIQEEPSLFAKIARSHYA